MKLTALQLTALQAFAGIGGSAYGPKSRRPRISRATARQLEAKGLAELTEEVLDGETYQWGSATEAGRRELVARLAREQCCGCTDDTCCHHDRDCRLPGAAK